MKKLSELILKLECNLKYHEHSEPLISAGSVGWHIEHSLLVLNAVTDALQKSIPHTYKSNFNLTRSVVMAIGKIPRGKVKAPRAVQPGNDINIDRLQKHILHTKENIKGIDELSADHYFTHPFMGDFKLKPALRFIKIHTQHHLRIINNIINQKNAG